MRAADKPLEELQKGIACPPLQNSYKNVLTVWTKELTAVTTSWCSGTSCAVYFDLLNEPFWLKRHKLVPSSHRGCICLVAFVFPLLFCSFIGKESSAAEGSRKAVGSPSLETITSWLDEILSALWHETGVIQPALSWAVWTGDLRVSLPAEIILWSCYLVHLCYQCSSDKRWRISSKGRVLWLHRWASSC